MKRYSLLNFPSSSDFTVELREMTYKVSAIFIMFCDLWYLPTACDLFCFKIIDSVQFSSVQSFSCVQLFVTPWTAVCQASLSTTNSRNLPKLMSIESLIPSIHLILCRPLLLLRSSIFPNIRVFSNESALRIMWPNIGFSFNISPSNEHPGLTSFRMTGWIFFFVDKVMSLLFNMLFRLVLTFLPRSKHLLISWLQSPSTVI